MVQYDCRYVHPISLTITLISIYISYYTYRMLTLTELSFAAQHVKLHAMANWGVNVDEALADVNPFFRQSSVVTVLYNYFGYTSFNGFFETWAKEGLVSPGWMKPERPLVQAFNHGIKANVWQHSQIVELVKYSEFVNFVVQVRAIFTAEFQKHKDLFPGTDGEASESKWVYNLFETHSRSLSNNSLLLLSCFQCLLVLFFIHSITA